MLGVIIISDCVLKVKYIETNLCYFLFFFLFQGAAEAARPDSPAPEPRRASISSGSPSAGPSGATTRVQEPSDVEEQGQSSDGEVSVILQSTRGRARSSILPPRTLGRTSSTEAAKRGQKRKHVDSSQVVAIHSAEALDEVSKKKKKKKKNYLLFCFIMRVIIIINVIRIMFVVKIFFSKEKKNLMF